MFTTKNEKPFGKPPTGKIRLEIGEDVHNFLHNQVHPVSTLLLLETLTRSSLVKAYHSVLLPEHWICKCYYRAIKHAILDELRKRGQIMLLRSCIDLKDLEKEDKKLPFFSVPDSPYLSVSFKNRKE